MSATPQRPRPALPTRLDNAVTYYCAHARAVRRVAPAFSTSAESDRSIYILAALMHDCDQRSTVFAELLVKAKKIYSELTLGTGEQHLWVRTLGEDAAEGVVTEVTPPATTPTSTKPTVDGWPHTPLNWEQFSRLYPRFRLREGFTSPITNQTMALRYERYSQQEPGALGAFRRWLGRNVGDINT